MDLKFAENEKVLCFHGPLLYEAKCLQAEVREVNGIPTAQYNVHYNGWNKSWDEWVDETRILKYNEENLNRQKTLLDSVKAKRKAAAPPPAVKPVEKKGRRDEGSSSGSNSRSGGRRRNKGDDTIEAEEEYTTRIDVKINIPDNLKRLLVDDWDYVTRQKKLVSLPRKPTVEELLSQYKQHKLEKHPDLKTDVLDEIIEGLSLYFDRALGKLLLYRFERPQYSEIVVDHTDKRMCQIYGAEHLLRLFVKLPGLLAHTNLSEESVTVLVQNLECILRYIDKQSSAIFTDNYHNATPDYCRVATST